MRKTIVIMTKFCTGVAFCQIFSQIMCEIYIMSAEIAKAAAMPMVRRREMPWRISGKARIASAHKTAAAVISPMAQERATVETVSDFVSKKSEEESIPAEIPLSAANMG